MFSVRRHGWELALLVMAILSGCQASDSVAPPASIEVAAERTELDVGQSVQATAVAVSASGARIDAAGVRWSSSDSLVARVSSTGEVIAEAGGTATIRATAGSVSGSLVVRVRDRARRVSFTTSTMPAVLINDTTVLRAVVEDSALQPMTSREVRWRSRNEDIATVSAQGLVFARAVGRSWIVAESGSRRDSVELFVLPLRDGPNRGIAYRTFPGGSATSDEVWIWAVTRIERATIPGRPIRSHRWSFDGSWLIVSYRDTPSTPASVEMLDVDRGSRVILNLPGVRDADLSPDKQWLTVSVATPGGQEIALVRPDGTDFRQVTQGAGYAITPTWSPDGRQIAFVRAPGAEAGVGELWLMNADGSSPLRVADRARNVAWSPDAKQLAFDDGDRVWLLRRDGSGLRVVSPPGNPNLATENGRPRFGPDARRIVHSYSGEVRVLSSDGSLVTTLSIHPTVKHADLSPRGNLVLFATNDAIRVMAASGGVMNTYIPVNNAEPFPLWRP